MKKLFTLLFVLMSSIGITFASDTQVNGIWYDFDDTYQTASVTYRGSSYSSYDNEYSGSVAIPTSVSYNNNTYSVTTIGENAFRNCTGLTSVTIPNSVTSIGNYAFRYCFGLTSVTIPNSVTYIGKEAFYDCDDLTSVTIPNSVTSIGGWAFSGCSSLVSPVYNAHVFAFMPTTYFGAYIIPDGIESVVEGAFYDCDDLTSVTIPNSVTYIGKEAFYDCDDLTSVTIPNSVTSIGGWAFSECSSLVSPVYNAHVFAFMPTSYSGAYTIPDGIESIAGGAFELCSGLTSVTIPNSVTSIGDYAFRNCTGLTSVTIPDSVTSISNGAFYDCSSLTSITIPNSVKSIKSSAFEGCTGLISVTIPNSVKSIEKKAFYDCTGLTSVNISDIVSWCTISFYHDSSNPLLYAHNLYLNGELVTDLVIPNRIIYIGDYAFRACTSLTSVNIPDCVMIIGYSAFYGCSGLTTVKIPENVMSIGDYAFYGCSHITSVIWNAKNCNEWNFGTQVENYKFGENVETIPEGLCRGMNKLTSIHIPNSTKTIGSNAFKGCSSLDTLSLGENIASYGDSVFAGCSSLTTIYNYRARPAGLGAGAFEGVDYFNCTLYILAGSIDMYKSSGSDWKDFYYIEPIGATETYIIDNHVNVTPSNDNAIFTWPINDNAASYSLQITKDGEVFCTLTFNSNGQLIGIAFAPSLHGAANEKAAMMSVSAMSFTVTGLNSASKYAYHLAVKDATDNELQAYSGEFATTGYEGEVNPGGNPEHGTEGLDDVLSNEKATKLLRNGQILIHRADRTYTLTGAEVK